MISAASPVGAGHTATVSGATTTSFTGGDFQTFLKMLTTQIKNQDPLNPMEGSDFAVQLATFSGVEQQVRTNDLLAAMAGKSSGGLAAVADWIGKEVRTTDPVAFDGTALTLTLDPEPDADQVILVTRDANGAEVSREDVGLGTGDVDWVGRDSGGTVLPSGRYSFSLESLRDGSPIGSSRVGAYARVTGAEITANGVQLSLAGGASTMERDVTALRSAGG